MPPKKKAIVKYKWQVQLAGKWGDMSEDVNDAIEEAFEDGNASVTLPPSRGQVYVITFSDMKQTNTTTPPHKKRNIQRVAVAGKKKKESSSEESEESEEKPKKKKKKASPKASPKKKPSPKKEESEEEESSDDSDAEAPPREEAVAKLVAVDKNSEEFWAIEDKFNQNLQGRNEDYVLKRIEKKQKPISFIVKSAQRVDNPVLLKRFKKKQKAMLKETSKAEQRERVSFHATHPKNVGNIAKTSLLRFKHPMNPCVSQVDDGWFGTNKKGVYVSRYADYTFKYANRQVPLDPGDTCKVIMFRTLVGKAKHIAKLVGAIDPTPGFHAHSSPSFLEWYLFDEDQLFPEYVIEVLAREDTRCAADDGADD